MRNLDLSPPSADLEGNMRRIVEAIADLKKDNPSEQKLIINLEGPIGSEDKDRITSDLMKAGWRSVVIRDADGAQPTIKLDNTLRSRTTGNFGTASQGFYEK